MLIKAPACMCLSVRCVRAYNSVRTVRVVLYVHFATYKDFGFTHEMAPKNTEHVGPFDHT